jgi:hypothetical protein
MTVRIRDGRGIQNNILETKGKCTEGVFVAVVVPAAPTLIVARAIVVVAVLADVLFADSSAEPLHHASDEGEHLVSRTREEADGV